MYLALRQRTALIAGHGLPNNYFANRIIHDFGKFTIALHATAFGFYKFHHHG